MIMWLLILSAALIVSAAGIIFLVTRVSKFRLISRLAGNKKKNKIVLAAVIVAAAGTVVAESLGTINLFVVAVYLSLFWLVSEAVVWLAGKLSGKVLNWGFYLAGVMALVVSTAYLMYGYYTVKNVVLTEYNITSEKVSEPLEIAMISDAHIGTTFDGEGFGRYVDSINELNPDIVVIAGDLIDGSSTDEDILDAVRELGRLKTVYGTFFVFGNHDKNYYGEEKDRALSTEAYKKALEENGIAVLEDEIVSLKNGYEIIGRQDKEENGRADISELISKTDPQAFVIDINHQPNDYNNECAAGVDLVLSGHTHGGQFLLIRDAGLWIGANDKIYGYEKRDNTNFIVSSGISDWAIDFKTGCVSEIVLIHIIPEH